MAKDEMKTQSASRQSQSNRSVRASQSPAGDRVDTHREAMHTLARPWKEEAWNNIESVQVHMPQTPATAEGGKRATVSDDDIRSDIATCGSISKTQRLDGVLKYHMFCSG